MAVFAGISGCLLLGALPATAGDPVADPVGYLYLHQNERGETVAATFAGDAEWLVHQLDVRSHLHNLPTLQQLTLVNHTITAEELKYVATLKPVKSLTLGLSPDVAGIETLALSQLEKMTWVEALDICLTDLSADDWSCINKLDSLRVLRICSSAQISDEEIHQILQCRRLEKLEISGDFSDEAFRHIAGVKDLRSLRCAAPNLGDASLEALARLKELRELDISAPKATSRGIAALSALPKLHTLILHSDVDTESFTAITDIESLQEIRLSAPDLTEENLHALAQMPNLYHLALRAGITPSGIECLRPLELRSLMLNPTIIDRESMDVISAFTGLERLELQNAVVSDRELASLGCHPSLKYLYLDNANLTDKSLPVLKSMNSLEFVALRGDDSSREIESTTNEFLNARRPATSGGEPTRDCSSIR